MLQIGFACVVHRSIVNNEDFLNMYLTFFMSYFTECISKSIGTIVPNFICDHEV